MVKVILQPFKCYMLMLAMQYVNEYISKTGLDPGKCEVASAHT